MYLRALSTALHARDGDSVLFTHQRICAALAVEDEVTVFQLVTAEALVALGVVLQEMVTGRRKRRYMCTSLGANPMAALLQSNSTCGRWMSQSSCLSFQTTASI